MTEYATDSCRPATLVTEQDSVLDEIQIQIMHQISEAVRVIERYERYGSRQDLDKAVGIMDQVVEITPQRSKHLARILSIVGAMLGTRFERTGSMDDLNRAVKVANMAVEATPHGHPNRAGYLNNLGTWLGTRFERTGAMDDVNRAVEVADRAVNATLHDHPNRAAILNNLGNRLGTRFEGTGSMDDRRRALSCYEEGWTCRSSPPSIRIASARRAATILASQQRWKEASSLLEGAVQLLPIVSPRVLANDDKQHMLGQFSGLASMAAAISLEAGTDEQQALELLELGRCVIAGLLLEIRTDISELKQQHPKLATEFESLRNELDLPSGETAPLGDTASLWRSQANRRFQADERLKELITEIRSQPGFENFLLPPTREELMAAASQGPIVIINVSSYRCDAFVIEHHQIRVLSLPNLKEDELERRLHQHSVGSLPTLQWLWTAAAGPILEALGYGHLPLGDDWPHMWWIPTGVLSHFPIHAAGIHNKGSTEAVLDRVMSSYASSVKALVYGRRHSPKKHAGPGLEHALLVAMEETPGLLSNSSLAFATEEVDMLDDLCPSLQLKAVMPPRHREEVLAHLRACKVFHFAGHGRSDPLDPSRSCLLLDDWEESPLTVGDLRDYNIQEGSPFLGYLSACSTNANKVDRLVDEGIHLASAFQLAGFRHVIGTLWEVSDSHCVNAAEVVYKTIRDEGMTDTTVCRGLHRAVRALREGRVKKTMAMDEGSSTGADANAPELSTVEGANNCGAEVVQEGAEDNVQVHVCDPATAAHESGPLRKGMLRAARDAVYLGSGSASFQAPHYWAPYIHFGV